MFYTRFYSLMSIDHNGTVVDTLSINTHTVGETLGHKNALSRAMK